MIITSLFSIFILSFVTVTNQSCSNVDTTVKTQVSGQSASVNTQIINKVNGVETKVVSSAPGEIKVSIKNGQVETQINITPKPSASLSTTVVATKSPQLQINRLWQTVKNILKRIFHLFGA